MGHPLNCHVIETSRNSSGDVKAVRSWSVTCSHHILICCMNRFRSIQKYSSHSVSLQHWTYVKVFCLKFIRNYIRDSVTDQNGGAVIGAFCVRPLKHWNCAFISHSGHGFVSAFLCVVSVLTWTGGLTAVVVKSPIFWDITPCSPLKVNRRFGMKQNFSSSLIHATFWLGLFFELGDGDEMFLRNVVWLWTDYTACIRVHRTLQFRDVNYTKTKLNSMAWVRKRTIPTDWATAACRRS
jgi:hypothetical protein